VIYDAGLAGRYGNGRRLRASDVETWMAAARPYLGDVVLDLGAGTGRFTAALAATTGGTVVACEPSGPTRAQLAGGPVASGPGSGGRSTGGPVAGRPAAAGPVSAGSTTGGPVAGRLVVGGAAEAVPFRDAVFDAVWASQVVHHVRDLEAFAAGVRRVLKPGGRLLLRGGFGVPDELPFYRYFRAAWPDRTEMTALLARVTEAAGRAGLARCAHLKVGQVLAESPAEFAERAHSRSLSNLAALDDDLFEAGLRALERDAAEARLPARIDERLDLVVFAARDGHAGA
jgi:ubiquinone/menaquinone biosynthesis C-methylase UbiE